MKTNLFAILALLWGSAAYSYPNIGDEAHYEGCRPSENGCIHFTKEHQIVSRNTMASTYDVNVRLWEQGSGPQYKTMTVAEKDLLTTKDIQQLFARCSGIDGKLTYAKVDVKVPAGQYTVCKVYNSETGDTAYMADVPFGVVKAEGPTINFELISFKDGSATP